MQIYLASQSPRRRALLKQIGIAHRVLVPRVDESALAGETPAAYVRRLARLKAEAGWRRVMQRGLSPAPVLAADTAVVLGRSVLGKPASAAAARRMLAALSGRRHEVLTAVALAYQGRVRVALSRTTVRFRVLSGAEIERYVASGEPLDKAGAYAIQGHGAAFVARIEGSHSGVMGLPLFETARLLARFGIRVI